MAYFLGAWSVKDLKQSFSASKFQIVYIQENADVNKVQQEHGISSENVVILKER